MKKTIIVKLAVDIILYVLLLLLMSEFLIREAHMWIGILFSVLFLSHNLLNCRWYLNLFHGRYSLLRILQTLINFLLLASMIVCMISGIFVLPEIFWEYEINVKIHLLSSAWAFLLMSVHLGWHWQMMVSLAARIRLSAGWKRIANGFFRLLALALFAYGLYVFADRRFYEELFLLIDFQKEYDYSKNMMLYLIESVALSGTFAFLTYYLKRLTMFLYRKRKERKNET